MLRRTKEPGLLGILSQNFQARPETAGFLFVISPPRSVYLDFVIALCPGGFFDHRRLDRARLIAAYQTSRASMPK